MVVTWLIVTFCAVLSSQALDFLISQAHVHLLYIM